jgi:hypothetical protein
MEVLSAFIIGKEIFHRGSSSITEIGTGEAFMKCRHAPRFIPYEISNLYHSITSVCTIIFFTTLAKVIEIRSPGVSDFMMSDRSFLADDSIGIILERARIFLTILLDHTDSYSRSLIDDLRGNAPHEKAITLRTATPSHDERLVTS